jgi:glycosyltransferase involved in cell wall biosynthesis
VDTRGPPGLVRAVPTFLSTSPPAVSVVLPAWNGAVTLGRAIRSITEQTFRDWELLVIDDGSEDASLALAREMAAVDPRIRVVARSHGGIVAALNAGLTAARGEFVARMDADDSSHRDRLAEQVAWLRAPDNADVGVVGCLVEFGGSRQNSEGYAQHVDWINSLVTSAEIAVHRFVESPFAHPSVMFRRELVARLGGYRDGDFPEDYELWLRWLDAGVRMAKVPRALLTWHDSPGRLSRTSARYDPEAFFRMKAEWIAREVARCGGAAGGSRDVWVWGAGRPTRKRAAHLAAHGVTIAGYIDVDAKKLTRALGGTGVPVIGPAELPPPGRSIVLGYVTSRGARDFIRADLRARGYVEGRDFLMCA